MRKSWPILRAVRWRLWLPIAAAALGWWFYAAPTVVMKRVRAAVAEPAPRPLIASRVDLAQVDAHLSAQLRMAAGGSIDEAELAHLLLYGWLPQQRKQGDAAKKPDAGLPARSRQTQLYHVRYKDINRAIAIFWDAYQVHEVIVTLERPHVLGRWRVTRVAQHSTCAYDLDCPSVQIADLPKTIAIGAAKDQPEPVRQEPIDPGE